MTYPHHHNPSVAVAVLDACSSRDEEQAQRAAWERAGFRHFPDISDMVVADAMGSAEPGAHQVLASAALDGRSEAMRSLGYRYLSGFGVPRDREAGVAWLLRAADAGDVAAMARLAEEFVPSLNRDERVFGVAMWTLALDFGFPEMANLMAEVRALPGDEILDAAELAASYRTKSH